MGVEPELARGAVRFSLGADNSAEQVDGFLQALSGVLQRLRTMQAVAV
jgi:cysteine desulfurase